MHTLEMTEDSSGQILLAHSREATNKQSGSENTRFFNFYRCNQSASSEEKSTGRKYPAAFARARNLCRHQGLRTVLLPVLSTSFSEAGLRK